MDLYCELVLERIYDRAALGCLVTTDQGSYFIAIGLGAVDVNGETCYAISLASPTGQAMHEKQVGDAVVLNGRTMHVEKIE